MYLGEELQHASHYRKMFNWDENIGKDKHSSLFCLSNKDEEKGFYCIIAGKVERWTPEKRNGEK